MKKIIKKNKEIILYLFFGVLTTLVNIISYYCFTRFIILDEYIANIIAWLLSIIFAFITNKLFVFESKNCSSKIILKEFFSFILCRVISLGIDMTTMFLLIDKFNINDLITKVIANIIVIFLNYIFSKLIIFHIKDERKNQK